MPAPGASGAHGPHKVSWLLVCLFGVLGPVACHLLGILSWVKLVDRLELSIEAVWVGSVVVLSLYKFRIVRSPRSVAVSSGVLCASGVVLTFVGVALLPVTVVALVWMIGFLGLVPFGMAWMLLRAAREAWSGSAILPRRLRLGLGASGAALAVLLPFGHPIAQQVSYEVAF